METLIKVIEIWTPSHDRKRLCLADSYYGDFIDFYNSSQDISFAFNEGLPGTAWANTRPVVATNLETSCFKRKQVAAASGITCAIAVPVFATQFLLSVIVFLCGDNDGIAGAIEVWGKDTKNPEVMKLAGGYYGSLKKFEWVSRRISFQKGCGLPGNVWDYHIPQVISDLSSSASFLRASNAQLEGLTTAFGIPFIYDEQHQYVLTFLSARGTPIARRFEIWLPDRNHEYISLHSGHSEIPQDALYYNPVRKGQGFIGEVWQTGCPAINHKPVEDNAHANDLDLPGLNARIALPVIENGVLNSIVAFTL